MNSHLTREFKNCFDNLPGRIKRSAKRAYKLWKDNPNHPGLRFKRVGQVYPVYSVRVGIGWRVLEVMKDDTVVWFWIGSHAEYEQVLRNF